MGVPSCLFMTKILFKRNTGIKSKIGLYLLYERADGDKRDGSDTTTPVVGK